MKKAYFILKGEDGVEDVVHEMDIHDGQKLYRVHIETKKCEEVELRYDKSSVMFDKDWHYCAALGTIRAMDKFNKYIEDEANKQPPPSEADKKN